MKKRPVVFVSAGLFLVSSFLFSELSFNLKMTNAEKAATWKLRIEEHAIQHQKKYFYEPAVSTLTGIIKKQTFWGPPNYGEDTTIDVKEIYPVLFLNEPIEMVADKSNEFNVAKSGIIQIQLLAKYKLDNYLNKKISIKGTLFGAQTGHHHTDVLLEVTEVIPTGNKD